MRYLKKISTAACAAALCALALTGCESNDLYEVGSPDWLSEKIDSIENAKNSTGEEVLEGMNEDVYTIGKTDFTSGWWSAFSKYYKIDDNQKWNAVFNLNINPEDDTYYKNFALIVTNDEDRGAAGYQEYGAFRFDATADTLAFNSQWGKLLPFKYTQSTMLLSPENNQDANVHKLGGKITLTVDRSKVDTFMIKITNGTVTKTYVQPYKIANINTDTGNSNIRCFICAEGSYIDFLQSNIEPIGGYTSAEDKQPLSMTLANVPDDVERGATLEEAMAGISATVTFEEGVTKIVPAAELYFSAIPDMDEPGEKTLIVIYNKTFKGEKAERPIVANACFNVVTSIASIEITKQPSRTNYYYYVSDATSDLTDRSFMFDPTGLEVTATYSDGTVTVIDNSKLNFTRVPASAGQHNVTISTANGKTASLKVNVAESELYKATPSPASLGNADCTSGWWSAFTDDLQVPVGKTCEVNFTNYSSLGANWNNFVIVLRNRALAEYAVVRADNYGWQGANNSTYVDRTSGGQADWPTWLAAMNGAQCTAFITNCNNGTADVQVTMIGTDGNFYLQYYLGITTVDPNDLFFAFTVDSSHLEFK